MPNRKSLANFVGSSRQVQTCKILICLYLVVYKTMSEQELSFSVAQRIIIKLFEGIRPSKILKCIQAQFGEKALSKTRVYEWHKNYSGGEKKKQIEHPSRNRIYLRYVSLCKVTGTLQLKKLLWQ